MYIVFPHLVRLMMSPLLIISSQLTAPPQAAAHLTTWLYRWLMYLLFPLLVRLMMKLFLIISSQPTVPPQAAARLTTWLYILVANVPIILVSTVVRLMMSPFLIVSSQLIVLPQAAAHLTIFHFKYSNIAQTTVHHLSYRHYFPADSFSFKW